MEQKKVREHQFDNMKALLIFLVVLGHVLKNFGTTQEANILYKIIFSFHMPAFLFVSGYFAKYNPKKVLSQMAPLYLVFQCIRFALDCVLKSIAAGHFVAVKVQFFTPRWTLWYLFAIMVYQLLLPVFDTENRRHRIAYLVLAFAMGLGVGLNEGVGNFMAMARILYFLPFFLLGYYEKTHHTIVALGKRKYPKVSRVVSAALGILLIAIFVIENKGIKARWFYGTESYDGGLFTWYTRLLSWAISLAWIWILLVWIPQRELRFVGKIGANTLSIYLLHSIVILILVAAGLTKWMNGNLLGIIVLSVALTIVLSWNGFEHMIRKIHIPYKQ
jgi:fucose 4-O-acetylase-like acetyltransferase